MDSPKTDPENKLDDKSDVDPISPSVLERKASFQASTEDLLRNQARMRAATSSAASRAAVVPPKPTARSTSVGILDKPATAALYRQSVQRSSSVVTPPSPNGLELGESLFLGNFTSHQDFDERT